MTTLTVVDGPTKDEGRREAIARRLRGELAMMNLKPAAAARICGVTQAWMSRRVNASVPFDVDDLDMVCGKLGISFDFVATGIRALPSPNGPGDGLLLPRLDSNQEPFGEWVAA